MRALALIAGLAFAPTAEAGFFTQDQYEPPSPHFGTLYTTVGFLAGGWGTTTLDEKPLVGFAWNGIGGVSVMVLPATKLGLRAGLGTYGAKTSEGANTPFVGLRQQAIWTDAIVEVELPYLRLYGGTTLLAASRVKAPLWQTDAQGLDPNPFRPRNKSAVGASYRHVAIGVAPRYLPSARQTGGDPTGGYGLLLEVRRTWMETNRPVDFAPNEAAGWMVMGTVDVALRANRSKYEPKDAQ